MPKSLCTLPQPHGGEGILSKHHCPHCGFFLLDGSEAEACFPRRYGLTKKQAEALEFIRGYIRVNKIAPTHKEIAAFLGYGKGNRTTELLRNLEDRGAISLSRLPTGRIIPRAITLSSDVA